MTTPVAADESARRRVGVTEVAGLLVLASVVATVWLACGDARLLGEDAVHLETVAKWSSPWPAFDGALLPARPLQWMSTWALQHLLPLGPAVAHLPAFVAHFACLAAVHLWLRRCGAPAHAALLAALYLAAAPFYVHATWLVASVYPLRVTAAFCACVLWWSHLGRPSPRTGLACAALYSVCLLAHESALAMAPGFVLGWWLRCGRDGLRGARSDVWTWVLVALATWRLADVFLVRPTAQYSLKQLAAIPGNVARCAFNVLPEAVREPLIDGLRGASGTLGLLAAAFVFFVLAALALVLLVRGTRLQRYLLAFAILEQVPAVLYVGVGVRNAHVSLPYVAAALGLASIGQSGGRRLAWAAATALLAIAWVPETWRSVRLIHEAGEVAHRLAVDVLAERERAGSGKVIAILDVPDFWGPRRQVPFMALGLRSFLARHGVAEPLAFGRTTAASTSTDVPFLTPAERERLFLQAGAVLQFDLGVGALVRRTP